MARPFKKLKTVMFSNDFTQRDLAEMLHVSQSYIVHRMTGLRPFTIDEVYAICDYFKIDYKDIPQYFEKTQQSA